VDCAPAAAAEDVAPAVDVEDEAEALLVLLEDEDAVDEAPDALLVCVDWAPPADELSEADDVACAVFEDDEVDWLLSEDVAPWPLSDDEVDVLPLSEDEVLDWPPLSEDEVLD